TWLSSRGEFMLIDNLVYNRGEIGGPWTEYRYEGNQLWKFRLWLGLGYLLVTLACGGGIAAIIFSLGNAQPGPGAIIGMIALGILAFTMMIALVLVSLVVRDFVVPAMYLNRVGLGDAWVVTKAEVLSGNVGMVILYFLMRIALGIPAIALMYVAACLTCCVAWIPFVGQFILIQLTLPIHVFFKAYNLSFVSQAGPQWNLFAMTRDNPYCPNCNYDLRGNPDASACPECGYAIEPGVLSNVQLEPPPAT
ncbi:MAG: hypothetical protein MI741_19770, partial [Rhodospirillales bacterium]|nr:hypothetical protein [Rhodospirillales bacterium]